MPENDVQDIILQKLRNIEEELIKLNKKALNQLDDQLFFGVVLSGLILFLTLPSEEILNFVNIILFIQSPSTTESVIVLRALGLILMFMSCFYRYKASLGVGEKAKTEFVVSDGLPAYIKAFKKEFFTLRNPRVKHIRKPRFTDPANNNIVERLNGTIREREKVMRGMKNKPTAEELVNGMKTYYNFIRPHQALNGKTPAEASELNLQLGKNKWLSLLQKAMKH